ncbi:TMEM165/GDT1 family protein [Halorutilales archaeon Cl-col2-1]
MAAWIEVITTAFFLQLMSLPGEKGQIVIAGLATKYSPWMVVAGASTAFGGWTVLEILLGNALKGALPEVYLDGATAALFFIFAFWILYTSPGSGKREVTDGGSDTKEERQPELPEEERFYGFIPSFSMMAVGEFGDKTQIITIGLAATYGAHPGIWVGEMLAIIPVSAANAYFFNRASHRINQRWFHLISAGIFLLFAFDTTAKYAIGRSFLPIG